MNLQANLVQQQIIKLAMTQELSQAIELLQYSSLELTEFLEQKSLDNPLIELNKSELSTTDYNSNYRVRNNNFDNDETDWIEQLSEQTAPNLEEFLRSQLNIKSLTKTDEIIFTELINELDSNGYLRHSGEQIARRLGVQEKEVVKMIETIQQLEPSGIAASNLQECLLLQIQGSNKVATLAKRIISEEFIDFAEKNWRQLAKKLQVSLKDIQDVFDFVQTLNPRPGAMFATEICTYIHPDVIVTYDDNEFTVHVVDEHLPSISYNRDYAAQLSNYKNDEVAAFLQEKSSDFNWIMKSLQQRNETLSRVVLAIIEKQQSFFRNSSGQLEPMTMKELAEHLEVHESTVSRTVREKYVQTPFGTYELRSFFTSTIQSVSAGDQSSAQVKAEIVKIVENEDKSKPHSDQKIANLLKENDGTVISRRTIAKYRDELKIPSSTKRRRFS